MKDYYIEREVDGHPICFNGCSQTKKEIVNDLNDMLSTITSLYKAEKQLQKDKDELKKVAREARNALRIRSTVTQCRATEHEIGILRRLTKILNSIGEDDE